MSAVPSRDLERALRKKGFEKENSKDRIFHLYVDGHPAPVRTLLSHTSNMDYGDNLLSLVAREMKLSKKQLLAFVECTLSEEAYLDVLREQGVEIDRERKSDAETKKKKR